MSNDYFLTRKQSLADGPEPYPPQSPSTPTSGTFNIARSNALSSKVTSVLSASYADLEIRDALSLLDDRQIENNAETRRRLRLDVQKEVLESNGDVIREFGHVAEQLKRIGTTIQALNQACNEMRQHITTAHQDMAPVLEEASELMGQKDQVETKQRLLQAFNTHFAMSEDDMSTLTSTAEPVNDRFFEVLARAKKIQADSEVLLGAENQRLGLELMDQISRNLNNAFQKLYRWIQREFKSLNLENPRISSAIRRALRVLAERPSLFQNCLDFFAEARENVLSDAFYTALTGTLASGEEDSSVKPIELVAHDPLRYVGDMLAWCHSAAVSEREALQVLFISDGDEIAKGIQAGRESEPWNHDFDEQKSVFDGAKALNELVDRDMTGVSRVLRQRLEQVVQSHEETILAYKIANLVEFYRTTFSKLLGEDSAVLGVLTGLEESAMRQFRGLMRDNVAALQNEQQAPANLAPSEFLQDGLKQLSTIIKTYDSSFASSENRELGFQPILAEAFDPFMKASDTLTNTLASPENEIFAINCLLAARTTLSPYDFTSRRVREIEEKIKSHGESLIAYQYSFFRHNSGLHHILEALATLAVPEEADMVPSMEQLGAPKLIEASQVLDDFLPSALMDAMENLKNLQSSKLAREVTEAAADRFCEDFEELEEKLIAIDEIHEQKRGDAEDETGRATLRALLPRTSAELRVLLS